MPEPIVTVLLPAYNAAPTIRRAINSIQAQTYLEWRMLVVDDGSTDGTVDAVRSFTGVDPRIRLLEQPHAGIVAALNRGLGEASGRFIARMDADDECHSERLARQVSYLQTHPEVGLVGCKVHFGGDPVRATGYALHVDWMNSVLTREQISLQRFVESPFAHPSVMFRRELPLTYGAYREGDFPEDYELWLRWMDAGVMMEKVAETLLTWNDPPDRLSRRDSRYDPAAFYRCKAIYLARWLRQNVASKRPLWVWGAGRLTRRRADYLAAEGMRWDAYIDIDPKKAGRMISGRPVFAPTALGGPGKAFVLCYVGKRGARELARQTLQTLGYVEGRDFLSVA